MTKEQFKKRWESGEDGGGINFDDIANCAVDWKINSSPRTQKIDVIRYQVLKAANTNDAEEFKPNND